MKKNIILGILGWIFTSLVGYKTMAQTVTIEEVPQVKIEKAEGKVIEVSPSKRETQEIIIRKNGEKDSKVTVEITGDKVLINGKPLAEFNEEGITINNRKMIIRDGNNLSFNLDKGRILLDKSLGDLDQIESLDFSFDNDMQNEYAKPYTFLGVSTEKSDDGAKIYNITKESPAEKAGLQKDDIIYKIDDKKVSDAKDLSNIIKAKKEGDKVNIYFLRDGKKKDVSATLGKNKFTVNVNKVYSYRKPNGGMKSLTVPTYPRYPNNQNDLLNEYNNGLYFNMRKPKLGIKIQDTEEGNGVKVLEVEPATAAATAGLLKDDVITAIGAVKVNNTDEAREQLQENKEKTAYEIKAKRNGTEMTFNIKIPKKLKTANL
jgi:serine protease Do